MRRFLFASLATLALVLTATAHTDSNSANLQSRSVAAATSVRLLLFSLQQAVLS